MNNNQFNKSMQTIKNYVDENIPTKTSELTNDSDYTTNTNVNNIIQDYTGGKKISSPMTKAEYDAIVNKDPNTIYLVEDEEESVIVGLPNYSTNDANKILAVNAQGTALAWIDKPTGSLQEIDLTAYAKKTDLPTKTSQLANDSGYLTEVPSEYITETELNSKLATKANASDIPSLNGYATETYVTNAIAQILVLEDVIEGETMTSIKEIISCTGLTLSSNTLSLNGLTSKKLVATKQPSTCTEEVVWSVSPNGVVTVNNGVVTSIANGSCIITATCGSQTATCNVTVSGIVVLGNLVVNKASMSIVEGASDTFNVTLDAQPNTDQTVTISVNNNNASVNPSSLTFNSSNYNVAQTVTVIGTDNSVVGDTNNSIITIASNGVSSKTINVTVADNDGVVCTGISLDQTSLSFATESPIQLTATKTPSDTTDIVAWNVTPSGIVTVNNGLVTPMANGNATITVTCGNQTATCDVTVSCFVQEEKPILQILTNSEGTQYYQINDVNLFFDRTYGFVKDTASPTGDQYNMYTLNVSTPPIGSVATDADVYMDMFEVFNGTAADCLTYEATTSKPVACFTGKGWSLRVPVAFEGTPVEYLRANLDCLKFKKYECTEFVIDPELITSMSVKENTSTGGAQYAQFEYSNLPAANIYKGLNTFSGVTATNANLTRSEAPNTAISTTVLSVAFPLGTFTEFSLDNVKAYFTEHPLVFYYV